MSRLFSKKTSGTASQSLKDKLWDTTNVLLRSYNDCVKDPSRYDGVNKSIKHLRGESQPNPLTPYDDPRNRDWHLCPYLETYDHDMAITHMAGFTSDQADQYRDVLDDRLMQAMTDNHVPKGTWQGLSDDLNTKIKAYAADPSSLPDLSDNDLKSIVHLAPREVPQFPWSGSKVDRARHKVGSLLSSAKSEKDNACMVDFVRHLAATRATSSLAARAYCNYKKQSTESPSTLSQKTIDASGFLASLDKDNGRFCRQLAQKLRTTQLSEHSSNVSGYAAATGADVASIMTAATKDSHAPLI